MTAGSRAGAVFLGCAEGLSATPDELRLLRHFQVAGITVFGRNITPEQTCTELISQVREATEDGATPLIAIDQEGGRVARFKGDFPNLGPAMDLEGGSTDRQALSQIEGYASALGEALFQLGVNVDFAPVADVLSEPTNIAIGDRAFSTRADAATARAGAFLRGLTKAGIRGCLKHFPGQGAALIDTHIGEAVIDVSLAQLQERELVPFVELMGIAPMIMISHCVYPALSNKPASISAEIMTGLLKTKLRFSGVVVSDDMTMGALGPDEGNWEDQIVASIAAGADLVLVCRGLEKMERALLAIEKEVKQSASFRRRFDDAAAKVFAMRRGLRGTH